MTDRLHIPEQMVDERIRPLEYSAHTIWAEAYGLKHLVRGAAPEEIKAVRTELLEAAAMIQQIAESVQ